VLLARSGLLPRHLSTTVSRLMARRRDSFVRVSDHRPPGKPKV
jgi:hypothetical protein